MNDNEKIVNTVFEDDLDKLLSSKGLLEKFNRGKTKCKFCGSVIERNNIHSLLPESGNISLICNKPDCVLLLMEYLEEKTKSKIHV